MSPEDIEIMSHINPEEFELSSEEILTLAFDAVNDLFENLEGLPKEHKEVYINNQSRIYWACSSLLESVDFEKEFYKQ